jgi:C-terminal processing protease CtpA/Prc
MSQRKLSAYWRAAVLSLLILVPLTARADAPAVPATDNALAKRAYIVLVGISKYSDSQILSRAHPEDDIKSYYDLFTDKRYLGVDKDHIRLLLGNSDSQRSSEPATHENILKALQWAVSKANKEDMVIFAFSGEGAPMADRACYFASDSTFKDRAKNAVAAAEIETALEKLKSDRFCAFVDVNFKGFSVPKENAPDMNVQKFYREFLAESKDKDEKATPRGRTLFIANPPPNFKTLDLDRHDLFAQVVLDGLRGKADRDGYEPDGEVTINELVEYVGKEIPELARRHGKTLEEKEEQAFVWGTRTVNYAITRNPAVTAKVQGRLEKFEKIARDSQLSDKLTNEGRNLLAHMPKLKAYRELRQEYQKLADGAVPVDGFEKSRQEILDGTRLSSDEALDFAAKVIQASQLLQREYVDAKKVNQGNLIADAIKGLYGTIDEKMPAAIKKRIDKANELPESDLTTLVADARQQLGKREDLEDHKDLNYALQHMMQHTDPYTTYIDPETLGQFQRETQQNFSGIGVQIRPDSATGMLKVISPIKGSPAYSVKPGNGSEAAQKDDPGLHADDIITAIIRETDDDGDRLDKPEVIPTKDLPINTAVKKIIGKPGTKVKLVIDRDGEAEPLEFEITRGAVDVETCVGPKRFFADAKKPGPMRFGGDVRERNKADDWNYIIDAKNKIAYVRLTSFARHTARDLARVLQFLKDSGGVKGFILDLRSNPGGLLQSAVEISDMFIDDGLIVSIRPRNGQEQDYTGTHEGSYLDFPMVCMVNRHSASGSEIVSACLQDHRRALIVGERSYGKGSVQNIQPFEGGEIKLTTASFWRPSGKNLNKSSTSGKESDEWGVKPDPGYAIKLSGKEFDQLEENFRKQEIINHRPPKEKSDEETFVDRQLELALRYLRDQIHESTQVKKGD